MAMATTYAPLPAAEHSAQLRKAVIASTVGTAMSGTTFSLWHRGGSFSAGFTSPTRNRLGDARRLWPYFVGFAARPVGAAIFGHYGDRIGRKATLIATLLFMGIATFLVAFVPTYASIGVWGAVILTALRALQGIGVGGEWGGSVLLAMEWSRTHGQRGLVASSQQFGVPCGLLLSNLAVLAFSAWSGDQFMVWGWRIPFALSIVLVGIGLWISPRHPRTPVFQQLLDTTRSRRPRSPKSSRSSLRRSSCRHFCGCPSRRHLHLHRLHLRLRGRHAAHVAGLHSLRGDGGGLRLLHYHPAFRPHL